MSAKYKTCIVIPCFNEGKHFRRENYMAFLSAETGALVCFVNDGSQDNTGDVLKELQTKFPGKVEIVSYSENQGKAYAVRKGIQHCLSAFEFDFIAYLDADLSVSLQECNGLTRYLHDGIVFCFGSRMARIGARIERKKGRFLAGRVIATIISEMLRLKVYDSQCGCKVFTREVAVKLFEMPFISTWLFDVEIFCRMIEIYTREIALEKMLEQPLRSWIDQGDSKVRMSYFFKMWADLYKIRSAYRKILYRP